MKELIKQKAYKKAFDIARSDLASLLIEERARKAGVSLRREGEEAILAVPFFNEVVEFSTLNYSFRSSKGSNVTLASRIMVLHYLIHASGEPVRHDVIPYEDVPGCRPYLPVFERRVVRPLLQAFGFARDAFADAGAAMGGSIEAYGNASFTLHAFPRVPITFILWEGEEDFPPSMKVLFDRSIHTYLPLEDIVVVSKMAATRLLRETRRETAAYE
jgi:hypothetical protein